MKKGRHPTLSEVAKKAGVGTTTVSRVINGGLNVNPVTLAHVRSVIDALGYMPNQAARILKGARTRTIGFVIPSIADPFFASCAEAAHAVAQAHDSLLIVVTTHDNALSEVEGVNGLLRHRVDGLLVAPANTQSVLLRDLLQQVSVPVVALDRPIKGSMIPCVVADNFAAAKFATQHLIEHGYKRIVCVTGGIQLFTIAERIRGYRKAMQDAGLDCLLDDSVNEQQAPEQIIAGMMTWKHPPDAIFTLKNSLTISTFEALQKLNIEIPSRVGLLGYDDFPLAATVRPSITVVQQPIEEIGRVAAELLFQRLLHPDLDGQRRNAQAAERVQVKTRLIRRSSCGCQPADVR